MVRQRNSQGVEQYIHQLQPSADQRLPNTWSDFLDSIIIGSGQIACACIYDSVSAEKWAGLGMEMSREEVIKLIRGFIDPTDIHKRGIQVDGKQYCCLSAHADAIVGRNSERTVTIARCRRCIVVGIHQHKVNHSTAHSVIVRLVQYLGEKGL